MTERFTRQGCKVTTTFELQPDGGYTEHVKLETVERLKLETVPFEDYWEAQARSRVEK